MTPDAFLSLFPGVITFQTFDDSGGKRRDLAKVIHGTLAQHADTLVGLNDRGAGVYFMVNEGDGHGRKTENVQRVRALFVDLDGAPLEPVKAATLSPHCIVESSPGRWHAYWLTDDCPLESFKPMQQSLAKRFNADPKVCDLPRVMRVPGFDHRKAKPFCSRVLTMYADRPHYRLADLVEAFGLDAVPTAPIPKRKPRALPDVIPDGERNGRLLSLAAGLVRDGFRDEGLVDRLQRINAERCQPPLCATEVDKIAAQSMQYGSDGFIRLPHRLTDSMEWRQLPPQAHEIILMAFRRFNGHNNGRIVLTWPDFASVPRMGGEDAFYRHRNRAIDSGILLRVNPARNGQAGRTPDFFAIADKWLPAVLTLNSDAGPNPDFWGSYIDKQALGDLDDLEQTTPKQNWRAA